jgi:hypothetical protein
MLDSDGTIELRHVRRRLPTESSVWIEIHDRESRSLKCVSIDLGDSGKDNAPQRSSLADATWKRSYRSGSARPLGLVAGMRSGLERRSRYLADAAMLAAGSRRPRDLRGVLWGLDPRRRPPLVDEYEADPGGAEQVLFQVTAWDPTRGQDPEDRRKVNSGRAAIIKALRKAIAHRFVGGFVPTPYARSTYPGLLSELPVGQRDYLRLVQESAITVSTVGLHGSNPWKLVEYLAGSRAIVSEPLRYELPESLEGTAEFFDDSEQCVERCIELLDSPGRRAELQDRSRSYWLRNARPDRLLVRRLLEEFDPP